jgi:hypothetical protein
MIFHAATDVFMERLYIFTGHEPPGAINHRNISDATALDCKRHEFLHALGRNECENRSLSEMNHESRRNAITGLGPAN